MGRHRVKITQRNPGSGQKTSPKPDINPTKPSEKPTKTGVENTGGAESKALTKKLTNRQKRFVEEYLKDMNATQAAIRAGYSERTARQMAAQNLTKLNVKNAVEKALREREERTNITQNYVLQGLRENVQRCMQAKPVLDREGSPTGKYTYHATGANRALELLGKHLGMFPTKVEISVNRELRDLVVETAKRFPETKEFISKRLSELTNEG